MDLLLGLIVYIVFSVFTRLRYERSICETSAGRSMSWLEASAAMSVLCALDSNLLPTLIFLCLVVMYILNLEYTLRRHELMREEVLKMLREGGHISE